MPLRIGGDRYEFRSGTRSDRALRSSVTAMDTHHNYYNTEWTPGLSKSPAWDDWFDPEWFLGSTGTTLLDAQL